MRHETVIFWPRTQNQKFQLSIYFLPFSSRSTTKTTEIGRNPYFYSVLANQKREFLKFKLKTQKFEKPNVCTLFEKGYFWCSRTCFRAFLGWCVMWVYAGQTTILDNFPLKRSVFLRFLAVRAACGVQKSRGFREAYLERSVSRFEIFFVRSSPNHLFRRLKLNYEVSTPFSA